MLPRKKFNKNDRKFTYDERKELGVVYTPQLIASFICKKAIVDYLNHYIGLNIQFFDSIFELEDNSILSQIRNVLEKVRVLEPAVGQGNFLIEIFQVLLDIHEFLFNEGITDQSLSKRKREILEKNLYGVDISGEAIASCKKRIKESFFSDAIEEFNLFLDRNVNLVVGNPFFDDIPFLEPKFFDLVVSNPPYIAWRNIKFQEIFEDGTYLGCTYKVRPNHPDAQPNLYLFFLLRGLNLLSERGILAYILPQEWLFHVSTRGFRDFLICTQMRHELLLFDHDFKIFRVDDRVIGTNSLILFCYKHHPLDLLKNSRVFDFRKLPPNRVVEGLMNFSSKGLDASLIRIREINFENFRNEKWIFLDEDELTIKNEILKIPDLIHLNDSKEFLIKGGFQPPVDYVMNAFCLNTREFRDLPESERKYVFPAVIKAREIGKYELAGTEIYWIVTNKKFASEDEFKEVCPKLYSILSQKVNNTQDKWWEFPNVRNLDLIEKSKLKIISPRVARQNSFAVDDQHRVLRGTNSIIIPKQLDIFYVLGIMNSKLASYWYENFGFPYHGGKSMKYEPDKLKRYFLPIRASSQSGFFSACARFLMNYSEVGKQNTFFNGHLNCIENDILNNLIFELYFKESTASNLLEEILSIRGDEFSEITPENVAEFCKRVRTSSKIQSEIKKLTEHRFYSIIMKN
ncbi:MAG: Eco57I restriction-modification methylase domain-containing protein [Candidatus Helarchaeota archaeon]